MSDAHDNTSSGRDIPGAQSDDPQTQLSPTPVPLTVHYAARTVMVHTVTATELETVASLSKSVHLAFFGLCVGALIAFGIVLSTSNIAEPLIHSAYVALLAVSGVGSLYFGIRAVIDYREARNKLAAITAGRQ